MDFSPELRRVKVRATRTEFWPGRSTAVTLSSDPAPCGLARWKNDAIPAMRRIPAVDITRILTGGRLRFAVPNSSAMWMVGPGWEGGGALTGGVEVDGGTGAGVGV